ncbi:hypothetical protein GK047_18210 [Paenibacillus sp. SYP-B3998]|uniref:Uncharacterized protein n=1 Tax=Paenibacillus sp. SYP-B3998 TaxID=2678564 RepID=A0A6G4A2R1_9BACL|nr:hypothetical protein [Paenibacillus sp. SYP-B3998]NEW07937.1 hypothetical protein [Paenibacillus sp. SYP-B3998]
MDKKMNTCTCSVEFHFTDGEISLVESGFRKYHSWTFEHQDNVWERSGGPALDDIEQAVEQFASELGMLPIEAVGIFFLTLIDRYRA